MEYSEFICSHPSLRYDTENYTEKQNNAENWENKGYE